MRPWIIEKEKGITDLSDEERVEEMVLEALMENTHDEIPYVADINCKSIQTVNENQIRIEVDIGVNSNKQQKIIIRQQRRTLVSIRQTAEEQLEKIFKKNVFLFLWIVINPSAGGSGA
jgi:GTPase Era involved in 16S rRNA processing